MDTYTDADLYGYDPEMEMFGEDMWGEEEDFLDGYGDDWIDAEGDEWGFLKKAWRGIKKVAKAVAPIAKKLAPIAGKVIGGAFGGPAGAALGGSLGGFLGNLEDEELYEGYDGESDTEDEMEAEAFYTVDGEDEDMAEAMADYAARAPSATDAQALAGAITITIASKAPLQVRAVTPVLSSATGRVVKLMRANSASRPLVKVMPAIQKKTVATLAKKAAKGKPVTAATAKRVMAKHTMRVLSSPREIAKALAKNEAKRRKINQKAVMRAEKFI